MLWKGDYPSLDKARELFPREFCEIVQVSCAGFVTGVLLVALALAFYLAILA